MPQIIKVKRGTGTPVSLQLAEFGFDKLNKKLFIGTEEGVFDLSGESYAKKTFVDSAVEAEADLREAADTTLTNNLDAEISRAEAAESDLADDIAAEATARAAAITSEANTRAAAITTVQGNIDTEKGRIDAILDASQADKDSFAEIVSLINSVDTENDTAFAGYVTSNNAALAQEVSDRTSGDSALGLRIDGVEAAATALTTRVSAAEQDILDEETARISAVSGVQSNLDSVETALEAADATLQSNIDAEASTRSTADVSLSNRLDALEGASANTRLDDLEAGQADHESRISSLESTIDGGTY